MNKPTQPLNRNIAGVVVVVATIIIIVRTIARDSRITISAKYFCNFSSCVDSYNYFLFLFCVVYLSVCVFFFLYIFETIDFDKFHPAARSFHLENFRILKQSTFSARDIVWWVGKLLLSNFLLRLKYANR